MKYHSIISFITIIVAVMAILSFANPKVAFAGPPSTGINLPFTTLFSTDEQQIGGGAGTSAESADPVTGDDIQAIAKRNADANAKHIEEGKETPNIPATAANLGRFQNRHTLSEEERQQLEPKPGAESQAAASTGGEEQEEEQEQEQQTGSEGGGQG